MQILGIANRPVTAFFWVILITKQARATVGISTHISESRRDGPSNTANPEKWRSGETPRLVRHCHCCLMTDVITQHQKQQQQQQQPPPRHQRSEKTRTDTVWWSRAALSRPAPLTWLISYNPRWRHRWHGQQLWQRRADVCGDEDTFAVSRASAQPRVKWGKRTTHKVHCACFINVVTSRWLTVVVIDFSGATCSFLTKLALAQRNWSVLIVCFVFLFFVLLCFYICSNVFFKKKKFR